MKNVLVEYGLDEADEDNPKKKKVKTSAVSFSFITEVFK